MNRPDMAQAAEAGKIVPLPTGRLGRIPKVQTPGVRRQRFRILTFENPGGSTSFRVQGMDASGTYHRENFADPQAAECRRLQLENEWIVSQGNKPLAVPQMTDLTPAQLGLAEAGFKLLERAEAEPSDLLSAIRAWIKSGRDKTAPEAPRLDTAVAAFTSWLDSDQCDLRPPTKRNLRGRVRIFANSTPNMRLDAVTPDTILSYLDGRGVGRRSAYNDRAALRVFFRWCANPPRRWIALNPARQETRERQQQDHQPEILTVQQVESLLRAAEAYKSGALVPYAVLCVFAGLRPTEAQRLTWDDINMADGEIRLTGAQTKTGRGRVIAFNDGPPEQKPFNATLAAWLKSCEGKPIRPRCFSRGWPRVRKAAGLNKWVPDVLRHTGISHLFRLTGSYGRSAELAGNTERIIKAHYQGRVSTADTKRFYAIMPKGRKS